MRNGLAVVHKRLKEDKIINRKSVKEILHKEMRVKKWKNEEGLEIRTDFGDY